jgi:glycosyltransferase involved in cell wall biosynthesis
MTSKRTVVLWAFICHPEHGSEGGFGWNWAQALARGGYDVHLVTMPTFRSEIEEQLSRRQADGGSVTVHYTPANDNNAYARGHKGRLSFNLDYLQWQKQALRESRRLGLDAADVGHHVSWGALLLGSRLDRLGPPFVFGPAGGGQLTGHELRGYLGLSLRDTVRTITVKHLSTRFPAARTVARAGLIVAANAGTEVLAQRLGARRVEHMLQEGVNESLLAPAARRSQHSRDPIVLWVGRFLPRKGAPLAVEAFAHVRRAVPTARLVMVGDGQRQAQTQRRAHELGLGEAVEFTGNLDWPSVQRLHDEADVFLYTSIRDTSSASGMEAAARGLPVVTLSHSGGGGCDHYPDAGVTKVSSMPVASLSSRFGQAVVEVLNADDYERRSKAMLGFAAENLWDAKASKMSNWYAELDSTWPRARRTTIG